MPCPLAPALFPGGSLVPAFPEWKFAHTCGLVPLPGALSPCPAPLLRADASPLLGELRTQPLWALPPGLDPDLAAQTRRSLRAGAISYSASVFAAPVDQPAWMRRRFHLRAGLALADRSPEVKRPISAGLCLCSSISFSHEPSDFVLALRIQPCSSELFEC